MLEAPTRRAEVDAAARRIRENVAAGMRFRDIAVLVRELEAYHDLIDVAKILTPSSSIGNNAKGLQGYARYWSEQAGEPWLYNASTPRFGQNVGVFISYDDPHSVARATRLTSCLEIPTASVAISTQSKPIRETCFRPVTVSIPAW